MELKKNIFNRRKPDKVKADDAFSAGTGFMTAVLPLLLLALLLCAPVSGETAGQDPHAAVKNTEFCLKCHTPAAVRSFRGQTENACSKACLTCHQVLDSHHPVNKRLSEKNKNGFMLEKERITCATCHSINKKRYDSSPWASQSLFDRIFKSSREYKTYYLIMKNNDGQLCKSCH